MDFRDPNDYDMDKDEDDGFDRASDDTSQKNVFGLDKDD